MPRRDDVTMKSELATGSLSSTVCSTLPYTHGRSTQYGEVRVCWLSNLQRSGLAPPFSQTVKCTTSLTSSGTTQETAAFRAMVFIGEVTCAVSALASETNIMPLTGSLP